MRLGAKQSVRAGVTGALTAAVLTLPALAGAAPTTFLGRFHTTSLIASAVPARGPAAGDQNPYGISVVPTSVGDLRRGDVLISNFNDRANLQGTGSSIVEVTRSGRRHVFAVVPQPTATPAVGLTTALVALRNGDVIVGSLPAPRGVLAGSGGALTVLDPRGHVIRTLTAPDINGPWDLTADDHGARVTLFVSNVLNGTVSASPRTVSRGTVIRIRLRFTRSGPVVLSDRVIASGFSERTDPNALVVGPTGLGLGRGGTLYVADSVDNRIAAIPDAERRLSILGGGGVTVSANGSLKDPLGLMVAPQGDIISANGGNGNLVETTPGGRQSDVRRLVPGGAGDLFGIAPAPGGSGLYWVNDIGSGRDANSLELLH